MPRPTVTDGSTLASSTVTVPACLAVNVRVAVPLGAMMPFSVSVTVPAGVVGVVGVDGLLLLLHAAQIAAHASSATAGQVRRAWAREVSTARMKSLRCSYCETFVTPRPRPR